MLNVGSNYQTSQKAVDIAEEYEQGVYAAVGLHPLNLDTGLVKVRQDPMEGSRFEKEFDYQKYKDLAGSLRVAAIGEVGFDYWYKPKTRGKFELFREKQKEVFLQQLDLARELNLPVIFHCRKAHKDLLVELNNYAYAQNVNYENRSRSVRGVVHCFTGTWQQAQRYLDMGLYLGFNAIIYKLDLDEVIKKTPLKRMLIETDCPFLTPPQRQGRNEPLYVEDIARTIAELRKESFEKIAEVTFQNAQRLFRLI